jgi:hypothetical protein
MPIAIMVAMTDDTPPRTETLDLVIDREATRQQIEKAVWDKARTRQLPGEYVSIDGLPEIGYGVAGDDSVVRWRFVAVYRRYGS